MIFQSLITIILFGAVSTEILNLRNISSIFNYFKNIEQIALNNYKFDSNLTENENRKVIDEIYQDKEIIFTQLRSISQNFERNYDETEWTDIIALIGINGFKIKPDYMVPYFYSVGNEIDNLVKLIDSSMAIFKPIGQLNFYNGNVTNFCTYTLPTLDPFFGNLWKEKLSRLYVKFIGKLVKPEMISILSEQIKNNMNLCGKLMSFSRALWNYYHLMIIKHIKYCVLMYFKWIMDVRCNNIPIDYDIKWLDIATDQAQKMINETRRTLHSVNYYVHNCDANLQEREFGDIDIGLTMIQTIVINENDLSTTKSCDHNCDLKAVGNTVNRTECYKFKNCQYMDQVDICQEKKSKRYKWVRDSNGNLYGRNKTCENLSVRSNEIDDCGYCFCTCVVKPSKSVYVTTAISFREQISNIKKNMVITGIQFIEQDYMIHIQTMAGKLCPGGEISNEKWNPLENFDYNESEQIYLVNRNGTHTQLSAGIDYAYPEIINLDDILAPPGFVITGVRFKFEGNSSKSQAIQLQIRVTPIDFVRGILVDLHKTHWIASPLISRTEMILENPNRPTRAQKNNPDSISSQFIRFQASDLRKDAGQSTVPFFDGQVLGFGSSAPLGGVGIFHKGSKGFGGYLAFRIFDFDVSKALINKF